MTFELHQGDCLDVLRGMADNSVDSIVTDPPYGLLFMGKHWDHGVPGVDFWSEMLRVLKPGGHLLSFGGSRTYHRMASAVEDAGFEIRDQIMWVYGSGFPKSHNGAWGGTALKPAHEPIVMARKPLVGTVEANWLAFGTGALNVDGCRVNPGEMVPGGGGLKGGAASRHEGWQRSAHLTNEPTKPHDLGRWPANLIHDGSDEVLAAFPQASGAVGAVKGTEPSAKTKNAIGEFSGRTPSDQRDGGGSAARFFYCAKASRSDRNEGCDGLPLVDWTDGAPNSARPDQINTSSGKPREAQPSRNHHPTVKPTDLMRYLCRLVTPPGGVVLDPFMGSGSTGKAAMLEGSRFIGIEREDQYVEIARARIEHAVLLSKSGLEVLKPTSERDAHTVDLFSEAP